MSLAPVENSEDELASRFAERHAGALRYVAAWNRWKRWTGNVWKDEETLLPFDLARAICRQAQEKSLARSQTVNAVVTLARADRRLAGTVDEWDRNPWDLNTPGGVIDLRNAMLRTHSPNDRLTKITGVAPDSGCPIPRWLQFLDEITGGDDALAAYLQRMAGYAVTGVTIEHALFFLYGTGRNGKGVFLNTLSAIFGDYATSTPIETFTASQNERHPTELADLRGARFVSAAETEEGRRWAEAKIKMLTGGDPVKARYMRQDFFQYTPQFKLIISGNHKPGLRTVDEAIRARFHLVPFAVTIPPEKRDPELTEKLKEEWPGILQWVIDGTLNWQERGLAPPEAVMAATQQYLESEDTLASWIEERCERSPSAWTANAALFADWKTWADTAGEFSGSKKRFSQALEARGFSPKRESKARGFCGLSLRFSEGA